MMQSRDDELCELFGGRLKIFQKRKGYRFSVDAILLGSFAMERAVGAVADLGTGSGVLPLIVSRSRAIQKIVGIEVQQELADLAQKNVSYNNLGDTITILTADIRDLKTVFSVGSFDTVISNPPFYAARSGRLNPCSQKAISRHELYGTLVDFLIIAGYLLKLSGRFITIYPCSRLVDLMVEMRNVRIEPKTLRFIHPVMEAAANLVMVEGIKEGGKEVTILPPLTLYSSAGDYTEETIQIFDSI